MTKSLQFRIAKFNFSKKKKKIELHRFNFVIFRIFQNEGYKSVDKGFLVISFQLIQFYDMKSVE